ncbi:nitrous oxide reductase family maturation protein NosD [Cesiribacter andamanensis]|uniref:Nitrous oxide reductase family maturation protein NosD n=1 Tax=Cesiribacter andamanensis AMV16 TaxID=1279009 RepID=M7N807_9BACT|nr:nitrous oxide reductase family maturation protein NosD [Cesiribacter andamanensis]EMR03387.1 nitrous oxide reductase family maturation protein NosD [Cesiribacter andamanensis AMV16]
MRPLFSLEQPIGFSQLRSRLVDVLLLLLVSASAALAADLEVGPRARYTTIAAAIAAAQPGDRVVVQGGVYQESGLQINKAISLIGKNQPVIDGNMRGEILTITSSGVVVKGFVLKNVEVSYLKDHAAIRVIESRNVTLEDNTILNAFFGIYLQRSVDCTIRNNTVRGEGTTETGSGNAIHLWYCDSSRIEGNRVSGHRDGIYLEFVKESSVSRNLSENNLRYGLHFMFSDGNAYRHNVFRKNGAGVAVMYTRNIVMEHNTFEQNWGSAAYGLLLKEISRSVIAHNTFVRNTTGIYMEGSSRLDIRQNNFRENGWAVRLLSSCVQDTFQQNNFIGNTFDIATNGNSQQNYFAQNYWDKYQGYDLDKDRVGDIPYRPVSLYSMVVEKVPPSIMFMRSFIVDLMDAMEKVFPSFTPEKLLDEQPSMVRW